MRKEHGNVRPIWASYSREPNAVANRLNRTLVEMARTMLHNLKLNLELWGEAVSNAAYTRNRCPTIAVAWMMLEEAWSEKRPCVAHMHVFGWIAYAKVLNARRTKRNAKATKCLFLGYCEGTKANTRPRRSSNVLIWHSCIMRVAIWRCIQLREMKCSLML